MTAFRIIAGSVFITLLVAHVVVTLRLRYWQWRVRRAIAEGEALDAAISRWLGEQS